MINNTIKKLNDTGKFLMLVQDLKGPKYFFNYKNRPKELNAKEAMSKVNKAIMTARLRK